MKLADRSPGLFIEEAGEQLNRQFEVASNQLSTQRFAPLLTTNLRQEMSFQSDGAEVGAGPKREITPGTSATAGRGCSVVGDSVVVATIVAMSCVMARMRGFNCVAGVRCVVGVLGDVTRR